jgi:hypothetical protein
MRRIRPTSTLFLYLLLVLVSTCVGWIDLSLPCRLKNQQFHVWTNGRSTNQRLFSLVLHGGRHAPFYHSFDSSGFDRSLDIKQEKLKRILKDELLDIVCNERFVSIKKPDFATIRSFVVKQIELNGDNSIGKIFFSGGKAPVHRRQLLLWLHENTRKIQHLLHTRLRHFRSIPRIAFHLLNPDASRYRNSIMKEIAEEQKRRARMDAAGITEETEENEYEEEFVDYEEIPEEDPSSSTYDLLEDGEEEYGDSDDE